MHSVCKEENMIPSAPAHVWTPYPAYKDSGVECLGGVYNKKYQAVFQTGLTGFTGCVLYFNPVHPVILSKVKKPQINMDERRFRFIRGRCLHI